MKPYYQDEQATIWNADCRDVLPTLSKVDLVLTDPPYGIAFKSHGQNFRKAREIQGDGQDWYQWLDTCVCSLAAFFSPYHPPSVQWRSVLAWAKGEHVGIGGDRETCWKRDFELIGVKRNKPLNGLRDSAVLRFPALSPPPTGHVAEKPLPLMAYLIQKLSDAGDVIVDPFMGSGTTLVAARDHGCQSIGVELDERWCEVAANRLAQGVLF